MSSSSTRWRVALLAVAGVVAVAALGLTFANLAGWTLHSAPAPASQPSDSSSGAQLCGPWALQHVAEQLGVNVPLAQIAEWAGTGDNGTTMLGLAQAAERMGLHAQGWEARLEDVDGLSAPAIAHFTSLHFVVLQPPCTDTITYWDPIDRQDHTVPREDFAARWSGYLMTVEGRGR